MMITETDKFLVEIEKLYTLKSVLSLRKLPSLRNNVFCVSCNEGDYIFKLAPLDTSKGIENEYRTIDAIHSCGGPVPIPFKSKVEDNPLVSCSEGIYVVRGYRHVAGNNPPVDKKTFFSFSTRS
jgi:Ser/Thr protein kinase RdoA (MazF antagonist)